MRNDSYRLRTARHIEQAYHGEGSLPYNHKTGRSTTRGPVRGDTLALYVAREIDCTFCGPRITTYEQFCEAVSNLENWFEDAYDELMRIRESLPALKREAEGLFEECETPSNSAG